MTIMKKFNIEKILDKAKCGDILGIVVMNYRNNEILYTQLTYDIDNFMSDVFYIDSKKYTYRNCDNENEYQEIIKMINEKEIIIKEILKKNKKGGFRIVWSLKNMI